MINLFPESDTEFGSSALLFSESGHSNENVAFHTDSTCKYNR